MREILAGAVLDVAERAVKAERDQAVRLLMRTLELREMGQYGQHKSEIRALLALIGGADVGRSAVRMDTLRAIEAAIVRVSPDAREAIELVHALQQSLKERFDAAAVDVDDLLGQACTALEELE